MGPQEEPPLPIFQSGPPPMSPSPLLPFLRAQASIPTYMPLASSAAC